MGGRGRLEGASALGSRSPAGQVGGSCWDRGLWRGLPWAGGVAGRAKNWKFNRKVGKGCWLWSRGRVLGTGHTVWLHVGCVWTQVSS